MGKNLAKIAPLILLFLLISVGDLIGIRHLMFLSHSYDHRNIDGALGGQFVRKVADYLENFDMNRTL